jgi:hypothetical protein
MCRGRVWASQSRCIPLQRPRGFVFLPWSTQVNFGQLCAALVCCPRTGDSLNRANAFAGPLARACPPPTPPPFSPGHAYCDRIALLLVPHETSCDTARPPFSICNVGGCFTCTRLKANETATLRHCGRCASFACATVASLGDADEAPPSMRSPANPLPCMGHMRPAVSCVDDS